MRDQHSGVRGQHSAWRVGAVWVSCGYDRWSGGTDFGICDLRWVDRSCHGECGSGCESACDMVGEDGYHKSSYQRRGWLT